MTAHSPRKKHLLRNRKGYSTIIGTIILVLVVLFLFFNVYMFMLSRDTDFQNAASRSQQLDADRNAESITITDAQILPSGPDTIIITCTLINNGSVPVQIVRLWLLDSSMPPPNITNMSVNIVMQSGIKRTSQSFIVSLPGALPTHLFALRLVTSRGNLVMANINY